jgi:hypothetical protein
MLQHAAPGGVRKRGKRSIKAGLGILNHMVQYVAERQMLRKASLPASLL